MNNSRWLRDDKMTIGLRMLIAVMLILVLVLASVFAVSFSSFISVTQDMACPEIYELENFYLLTLAPVILIFFSLIPGILVILNFKTQWWKISFLIYISAAVILYSVWFIIVKINC